MEGRKRRKMKNDPRRTNGTKKSEARTKKEQERETLKRRVKMKK
jgi:hypothetical protein